MAYTGQPAFVNDYYQNLLTQAYRTGMQPYQATPVPGVAALNDWQTNAMDIASAGVGAWMPYYDNAQDALQQGSGQLHAGTTTVQYDPAEMQKHLSPYLPGVLDEIQRRGNENFANVTTPGLNSNFGMAGQFGSGRHENAMGNAASLNQREITGAQANAANTAYDQAAKDYLGWGNLGSRYYLDATNQANSLATGWQNLGSQAQQRNTNDIGNLTSAGQMVNANEQQNLNWANQQFQQQQQWPWQQIQNMTAALGNGMQFSTNVGAAAPNISTTNPYGGLTQFANNM